jgi:mRNA interferase MazF
MRFLTRATVAPITTTVRGIPSEVVLGPEDGMKEFCAVNLDNIQTVLQRDLGALIAILSSEKLDEVETAIGFALGFSGEEA